MKKAVLFTWAFAAAVSLLNFGTLWPLLVTPLAPLSFERWLPFLVVPLGIAAALALITFLIRRNVILINVVFWLGFFGAAEAWSMVKKFHSTWGKQNYCYEESSFLHSLTFANHAYQFDIHAAYILPDRVMLWSYADMDYFEVGPNIYRNLDFAECRSAVQALLEKNE